MTGSSIQHTIQRAIERGGFIRHSSCRLADLGAHKEWMHFALSAPDLDVFVNFSVMDDVRHGASPRSAIARLTCAVRSDRWDGDIDHFEEHEVSVRAGGMGLTFGANYVHYLGGSYGVLVQLRKRPIQIDLTFVPVTIASQVNNIALGDAPPMHWFVVPKLLASGEVIIGDQRFELENVPAYHDHNWGYFHWGQDFAWVWGYGHAGAQSPWLFVFDRLSNRARTTDLLRGILVWKGARHHRLFGGAEIQLRSHGSMPVKGALTLPRVAALLRPESATNVPASFEARAAGGGDVLEIEFRSEQLCQLVVPNDRDLGATIVSEVSGTLVLSGCIHGERIDVEGRAMFEFLGD
jgi:hypothetical protein